MAKSRNELPGITTSDAIAALETHLQMRMMWMLKAQTLLQLIAETGADGQDVKRKAAELAESMPGY